MKVLRKQNGRRVPEVFQIEASECGAASLCMILAYYGRYEDLTTMRAECHVSRDGSRLIDVANAAEKYGMKTEGYLSDKNLTGRKLPAIVLWKNSHFLVVEKVSDEWIWVVDPAFGRRRMKKEEFAESFSRIVLELEPGEDFQPGGKPRSLIRPVMQMMNFSWRALALLACLSVMINIVGLILPIFSSLFVDYYLPSLRNVNMTTYFAVFALTIIVQAGLMTVKKRVNLKAQRIQSASVTGDVTSKLLKLPVSFFGTRNHAAIDAHLSDIDSLTDFASTRMMPMLTDIVFSVLYFVLLFVYSVKIAGATLLLLVVLAVAITLLLRLSRASVVQTSNQEVEFFTSIVQNVHLFETIKSVAMEDESFLESVRKYSAYRNAMQTSQKILAVVQAIPVAVPLLVQIIVIATGASEVIRGTMSVGEVLACQAIAMSILTPVIQIIGEFTALQAQRVKVGALEDIALEKEDPALTKAEPVHREALRGGIELEDLSFRYNASRPPVIENISACVEPGHSLAVVGGSGSGKSTILRLLEGLYLPEKGEIRFDGVSHRAIDRAVLAAGIGVVSQSPAVFTGTVRENITLFDRSISIHEVSEAAKAACVYDAIESHEDGFNAMMGPGESSFSGGEIQRIMIARALVRKPRILILDEATSALDTVVEEQVMRNIRDMKITLIVVAHRLSAVRDCDEILVMEKGHIVQRGSHEKLAAQEDGLYRQLMNSEEADEQE